MLQEDFHKVQIMNHTDNIQFLFNFLDSNPMHFDQLPWSVTALTFKYFQNEIRDQVKQEDHHPIAKV